MATIANGKIVNNIEFNIDNKSWKNLDKFQQRLKDLKKQMSGLTGSVKMTASLKTFTTQVESSAKRIAKAQQTINNSFTQSAPNGVGHKTPASKTAFADQLRQEQRQIDLAHKEALKMDRQRTSRIDVANIAGRRAYSSAAMKGVKGQDLEKLRNNIDSLSRSMIKGDISIAMYRANLNSLSRDTAKHVQNTKGLKESYKDFRSELIQATAAFTAYSAAVDVFNTGKQLQSLEAGMAIFAKNDTGVAANMEYIRDLSLELGTNFMVAAKEFTKFSIVSKNKMSSEQTRALFKAYSEVATVQQMDTIRFERGLNALNIRCFIQ